MHTYIHMPDPVMLGKTDRTNEYMESFSKWCVWSGCAALPCCTHGGQRTTWRSLSQSSFHHVGSGNAAQVGKLIGKHFYLINYLASPQKIF